MMRYMLIAIVGLGLAGLHRGWAFEEDKKAEEAKLESKRDAKTVAGTTIDFSDKLELPFTGLTTLGARIEQARTASDPVCLSQLAAELGIAEKVSGKKAPITSTDLTKEAVALAKMRARTAELKAVALTIVDAEHKAGLEKAVAAAVKRDEDMEKPRGIFHELVVYNRSPHHLHIYVNGYAVGHVDGRRHAHFRIHTHGHTDLEARGGGHRWHRHVEEDYNRYNWTLNH